MQAAVRVFVVPGAGLVSAPVPDQGLSIEAPTTDGLRDAARAALVAAGYRVRSVSFGPAGLVAYVEPRA